MRNRLITTEPRSINNYRGITMHADADLHEQMFRLVSSTLAPGSSVIDVGAGAGAFSARLFDAGYRVTPVDIDREKWTLPELPLRVADLNEGIPADLVGTFDAACALEIIEHVENPWKFMRDMALLVRPGGLLFLSTPNVASFFSRAIFLVKGRLPQFDTEALEYGHINPMTPFHIEVVARGTGWQITSIGPGGYLPVFDLSVRDRRLIPRNLLRGFAYLVARGPKQGWCTIAALRRTPDPIPGGGSPGGSE